jgi:hypothetical protein
MGALTDAGAIRIRGLRRPLARAGGVAIGLLVLFAGLLAGTGWLYVLRGLQWLGLGPRVADSLPLLQLASFDGQPLLRVLIAWVLAGALAGVALAAVPPRRRAAMALVAGLVLLALASQASYALARNLGFADVVFSRTPGSGPVVEAAAFALGCWLPRALNRGDRRGQRRRSLLSRVSGFDDLGLRGGQHRHAAQDHGNGQRVGDRDRRARA